MEDAKDAAAAPDPSMREQFETLVNESVERYGITAADQFMKQFQGYPSDKVRAIAMWCAEQYVKKEVAKLLDAAVKISNRSNSRRSVAQAVL